MRKSSRTQAYVVQTYQARGRTWEAGNPVRMASRPQAMRLAEGIAPLCLGVTVIEMEVAEDVDYCGEPRVLATYGEVPEAL